MVFMFFFFKQNTAYVMRISDWSSDVCSSDLLRVLAGVGACADGHWGGDLGGTLRHLRVEIFVSLHMHYDNAAIVIARLSDLDHFATGGPKGGEVIVYARCTAHSEWAGGRTVGEACTVFDGTVRPFAQQHCLECESGRAGEE